MIKRKAVHTGWHSVCSSAGWGSEITTLLEELRMERKVDSLWGTLVRGHGGHLSAIIPEGTSPRESLVTAYSHSCNLLKHITKLESFGTLFCLDCYCKHMRRVQQELFCCFPECMRSGCTFCDADAEWSSGVDPGHQERSCQAAQGGGLRVKSGCLASRIECWWHNCKTCQE